MIKIERAPIPHRIRRRQQIVHVLDVNLQEGHLHTNGNVGRAPSQFCHSLKRVPGVFGGYDRGGYDRGGVVLTFCMP